MAAERLSPDPPLPPLLKLQTQSGTPTREFSKQYDAWTIALHDTFPEQDNPDVTYPPRTAARFLAECFAGAPPMHQGMAREIMTYLVEIEQEGDVVNGKKLYDHQKGNSIWAALALCRGRQSPDSLLIRGKPGTGKTLTLGGFLLSSTRQQMRGMLDGAVAYATQKPFHLAQQIQGSHGTRARILRAPPYGIDPKEAKELYRRSCQQYPVLRTLIRAADWETLIAEPAVEVVDARRRLDSTLAHRAKLQDIVLANDPHTMQALRFLSHVLAGQTSFVKGPSGDYESIDLLPPENEGTLAAYGGDAAWHIPPDFPVLARDRAGIGRQEEQDPKLLLTTALTFTSALQRENMRHILGRVRVAFMDEARRIEPGIIHGAARDAGAKKNPIVFAATGLDYATNARWDALSPQHSLAQSIERGVLPPVAVDVFPGLKGTQHLVDSPQAIRQLLDAHFEELALPETLKCKQPRDCHTLMLVSTKDTGKIAALLREQYAQRGLHAEVHCFDTHASANEKQRLQFWFSVDTGKPKVLVAPKIMTADALDFPTIENVTVGSPASKDLLMRLLGRLAHSARRDRGYFRQQQFANASYADTLFTALEHSQNLPHAEGFPWVPLHALLSNAAHDKDARLIARKPKAFPVRQIPSTRTEIRKIPPLNSHARPLTEHILVSSNNGTFPFTAFPQENAFHAWIKNAFGNDAFNTALIFGSVYLVARDAFTDKKNVVEAVQAKLNQLQS